MAIKSPCVGVCKINHLNGLCIGCYRTLDEIAFWQYLDEAQKETIVSNSEQRMTDFSFTASKIQQE